MRAHEQALKDSEAEYTRSYDASMARAGFGLPTGPQPVNPRAARPKNLRRAQTVKNDRKIDLSIRGILFARKGLTVTAIADDCGVDLKTVRRRFKAVDLGLMRRSEPQTLGAACCIVA